jgi:hypothetical protein
VHVWDSYYARLGKFEQGMSVDEQRVTRCVIPQGGKEGDVEEVVRGALGEGSLFADADPLGWTIDALLAMRTSGNNQLNDRGAPNLFFCPRSVAWLVAATEKGRVHWNLSAFPRNTRSDCLPGTYAFGRWNATA